MSLSPGGPGPASKDGSGDGRPPYMALYRSWRPQLFAHVLGQEHITRSLQNALARGRIAHAYLFCGQRGTGKTTMAKLLGKALNCLEGVKPEPCNRCRSCVEVTEGRNLDVLEIDAASNRGIDEIRDLREKVRYAPAQNRYKVYIIDEVHMLTPEAFNALLKILEEPPARVVFILATTEAHRLPLTIVSRCQRYDFHLLEAEQLTARLREVAAALDFSVEEKTLALLARQAEGAVRDALGLLEQCRAYGGEAISYAEALEVLGLPTPELLYRYYQAVIDEDLATGLELVRAAVWRGLDLQRLLKEQTLYLRKLLLLQAVPEDDAALFADVPAFRPYLLEHRHKFPPAVILEMLEILQRLAFELRGASQPQFLLELAFLRLTRAYRFRRYLSPAGLLQSLEQLEERLLAAGRPRLGGEEAAKREERAEAQTAAGGEPPEAALLAAEEGKRPAEPGRPETEAERPAAAQERGIEQRGAKKTANGDKLKPGDEAGSAAGNGDGAGPLPLLGETPSAAPALNTFWEEQFLARLKKERKLNLVAYLMEAAPLSFKGGIFAVGIPPRHAYVKKRLEDGSNRRYMEKLLEELLGAKVKLQFIVGPTSPAAGAPPGPPGSPLSPAGAGQKTAGPRTGPAAPLRPGSSGRGDEGSGEYLLRHVLELFQGRLIEVGQSGDGEKSKDKKAAADPAPWLEEKIPLPEPPLPGEDDID